MQTFEVRSWDDLSEPRTVEATEELHLGIDGEWFKLDLSAGHYKEVVAVIRAYTDAGRLAERPPKPPRRRSAREEAIKYQAALRAYAVAHGYTVSSKGYVAKTCRDEYEALNGPAPIWRKP